MLKNCFELTKADYEKNQQNFTWTYDDAGNRLTTLNNSSNGDLIWTYTNSSAFFNALTSGNLTTGTVVFGLSEKGRVVAVDGDNGALRWEKKFGGVFYTSPLFISNETGKYLVFSNTQGDVIKVDAENGNQVWLKKYKTAINSSPTYIESDKTICFGTEDGRVVNVNLSNGVQNWEVKLLSPIRAVLNRGFGLKPAVRQSKLCLYKNE